MPAFTNPTLALTPKARSREMLPASSFDAAIGWTLDMSDRSLVMVMVKELTTERDRVFESI